MNHPVLSSTEIGSELTCDLSLSTSLLVTGRPGYSCCPHIHRVSSSLSSLSFSKVAGGSVFASSCLLLVLRGGAFVESSWSSDDREFASTELWGEGVFWCERAFRSRRPDRTDDVEEWGCCWVTAAGWAVGARVERRSDMVELGAF